MKQTIAIIGSTTIIGAALARSLLRGNYRLLLSTEKPGKVNDLVKEIKKEIDFADVEQMNCNHSASWEADIIIAAVPYTSQKDVFDELRLVANGKIVISVVNPLNDNYENLSIATNTSAAEELQKTLPNSKVVTVFNATFPADFIWTKNHEAKLDVFIAGDDDGAIELVCELVSTAGFNPIVVGNISASRTLERMQSLLIQIDKKYNYKGLIRWKISHTGL
jgi:NADPH-dependent F420 reductase